MSDITTTAYATEETSEIKAIVVNEAQALMAIYMTLAEPRSVVSHDDGGTVIYNLQELNGILATIENLLKLHGVTTQFENQQGETIHVA